VPVATDQVEREAAVAAATAVGRVGTLLEECARTPAALLKTGGVGARELRRLGKGIGADEDEVRLWLELAVGAGLATPTEEGVLPTKAYDEWRQQQPAEQLAALLEGWRLMQSAPLAIAAAGSPKQPALSCGPDSPLVPTVRVAVTGVAVSLPAGAAAAGVDQVVALTNWLCPVAADGAQDLHQLACAIWLEAGHADGTLALERPPSRRAAPEEGMPAGRALPVMMALDQLPDDLLDELGGPSAVDQLLALVGSGGPPPAVSEPAELARRLLGSGRRSTSRAQRG
jgi:hypothetical protein